MNVKTVGKIKKSNMKIIKNGNLEKSKQIKRFKCDNCGCVFETEKENISICVLRETKMFINAIVLIATKKQAMKLLGEIHISHNLNF